VIAAKDAHIKKCLQSFKLSYGKSANDDRYDYEKDTFAKECLQRSICEEAG
jgi:hypothetical protein